MKTKQEIVENWLPRYTKRKIENFSKHILLTNFSKYVEIFANHFNVPILGEDGNMPNASAEGVTIINFRSEERRVGKECRSRWSPYH